DKGHRGAGARGGEPPRGGASRAGPRPAVPPGRAAARAAAWMVLSVGSFILMAVAAPPLSGHMLTFEILFMRSLVGLLILLALIPRLGPRAFATRRLGLHVLRNVVHFFGQYSSVWWLALAPLGVVTAIEFPSPVWVALLAALFLRERLTVPRWAAVVGGVAGVLVVTRPGAGAVGPGALVVLAGSFFFAAAILMVKSLLRTD